MEFSCLVPVYNTKPSHLFECLDSLVNQTVPPTEIVVVDDGSDDDSTILALDLAITIYGIFLYRLPKNYGTPTALNEGHKLCKYDWIAVMGSDDIAFPNRFEKQIDFIEKNSNVDIVGTALFSFDYNDLNRRQLKILRHREVRHDPDFKGDKIFCINHGTAMYKKNLVLSYSYDPSHKREQDVQLWARMLRGGVTFYSIPDVLYAWRFRVFKPT